MESENQKKNTTHDLADTIIIVDKNIYLGNNLQATNKDHLTKNNIKYILLVGSELEPCFKNVFLFLSRN